MVFQPSANAVQCAVLQRLSGEDVVNVLTYDFNAVPSAVEVAELAEELATSLATSLPPYLSDKWSILGVRARSLATEISPQAEYRYPAAILGTFTGDAMPNNVALVLTLRTAIPGRSYRGRIYACGLAEETVAGNNVNAPIAGGLRQAWANVMSLDVGEFNAKLAVLSRVSNGALRPTGYLSEVTSVALRNTRVDTQRRRLPR